MVYKLFLCIRYKVWNACWTTLYFLTVCFIFSSTMILFYVEKSTNPGSSLRYSHTNTHISTSLKNLVRWKFASVQKLIGRIFLTRCWVVNAFTTIHKYSVHRQRGGSDSDIGNNDNQLGITTTRAACQGGSLTLRSWKRADVCGPR